MNLINEVKTGLSRLEQDDKALRNFIIVIASALVILAVLVFFSAATRIGPFGWVELPCCCWPPACHFPGFINTRIQFGSDFPWCWDISCPEFYYHYYFSWSLLPLP